MIRVDFDEIYIDYVGRDQYWMWQDRRFTGVSVEVGVNGNIVSETTYVDGIENGPERTWHYNGQLKSEGGSRWNRPHGFFKEWYESGQLRMEGLIKLGYVVWRKEYDEEENLTTEYKIEKSPNMLRSLEVDRKCFRDRYPSYTQLSD
jgi:hypothetical protein